MFQRNKEPLTVIVHDGRWDCYGPVTRRNKFLYSVLARSGGVRDSVPAGRYHFNVKWRGLKVEATLTPVKD
jgi:hypothetical protein